MPQVQRIDPIVLPSEKESVAAYCRVSTDSADQFNSYHSQIAYYTQLINENPDWELYDIYADAGITGTSIDKSFILLTRLSTIKFATETMSLSIMLKKIIPRLYQRKNLNWQKAC